MIPEGKRFKFYRKSSFGLSTWTLWYQGNIIFYSSAVSEGGAEKQNTEVVELNQSGRPMQAQIELQMQSRLSRMLDRGYKPTREEALMGATNQLGLVNPMLAQSLGKVATPHLSQEQPGYMQIKYNGHRCLVTRYCGKLFAYSRKGKEIKTMGHILEILDPAIPEDTTIDGELYIHGLSLQAISSIIKRDQAACKDLVYHVYDIVDPEPFYTRWKRVSNYIGPVAKPSVFCVPTEIVTSLAGVYGHFRSSRAAKHEGSMLRLSTRGYEDGKRSDQLLKVKERDEEDFEVVDVKPGKHQVGILILKLNDRPGTFDCLAPGSVPNKQEILANKDQYIKRKVTVEFAEKTADGIPFHGVAIQFVEEL